MVTLNVVGWIMVVFICMIVPGSFKVSIGKRQESGSNKNELVDSKGGNVIKDPVPPFSKNQDASAAINNTSSHPSKVSDVVLALSLPGTDSSSLNNSLPPFGNNVNKPKKFMFDENRSPAAPSFNSVLKPFQINDQPFAPAPLPLFYNGAEQSQGYHQNGYEASRLPVSSVPYNLQNAPFQNPFTQQPAFPQQFQSVRVPFVEDRYESKYSFPPPQPLPYPHPQHYQSNEIPHEPYIVKGGFENGHASSSRRYDFPHYLQDNHEHVQSYISKQPECQIDHSTLPPFLGVPYDFAYQFPNGNNPLENSIAQGPAYVRGYNLLPTGAFQPPQMINPQLLGNSGEYVNYNASSIYHPQSQPDQFQSPHLNDGWYGERDVSGRLDPPYRVMSYPKNPQYQARSGNNGEFSNGDALPSNEINEDKRSGRTDNSNNTTTPAGRKM